MVGPQFDVKLPGRNLRRYISALVNLEINVSAVLMMFCASIADDFHGSM